MSSNTEKLLKNSTISVIAQIATFLLLFIKRKVFVIYLDIEYLGYLSLFTNLFLYLSVTELGISSLLNFHLFKAFAEEDKKEISKLMFLYKWFYVFVALSIFSLGALGYNYVEYFIKDSSVKAEYIPIIYWLQLLSIVIDYLFIYKRYLYVADQREYITVKIDLYTNLVIQSCQLVFLALFQNFLTYLVLQVSTQVIADIIITKKSKNDFPQVESRVEIPNLKEYLNEKNLLKDLKNLVLHRLTYAVFFATDTILISKYCGIKDVALYSNYMAIKGALTTVFFFRFLQSLVATIGNVVYSNKDKDYLWKQFQTLDLMGHFLAILLGTGMLIGIQPIINLWLGSEFLLSREFVILFALFLYFQTDSEITNKYRATFGDYSVDRRFMILAAILNIILSVILGQHYGMSGILTGSILSFIVMAFGRAYAVVKYYFCKSFFSYLAKHLLWLGIFIFEAYLCFILASYTDYGLTGFIIRVALAITIPILCSILLFHRNSAFKDLYNYGIQMIEIVRARFTRQ